ncbi:MAG: helix-turn-helix transcriptional regulator [Bryobacterales bacterium]|nr:helix-turn-helix transcriptional regulator [Bryobacterales bacterium]
MLNSEIGTAAPVFAALGDETRLRLLARLCAGGRLSITELSEKQPMTRQAVTKHLHVLSEAGLVKASKQGRQQVWEMSPEKLKRARRWLKAFVQKSE